MHHEYSSALPDPGWNVKPKRSRRPSGYPTGVTNDDLRVELRALRERKGLSQRALAERIGFTQGWVNKVETGLRGIDLPVVDRWATACGAVVTVAIGEPAATSGAGLAPVLAALSPAHRDLVQRAALALAAQSAARQALILEGLAALAELDDMKLPLLVGILQQQAKPAVVSEPEAHYAMGQRKGG